MKNIYFILIIILLIIYISRNVIKSRLSVKESFFWMFGSLVALILSIFPNLINYMARFFGVSYPPSLFFVLCILFLLFMCFRDSKRIAEQNEKIVELGEQVAYLKNEVKKKTK